MKVGFIGLGNQGMPIARRIAEADIPITVWARRPEIVRQATEWGAEPADSAAALGAACDVVGICVFDVAGVEEVLFGPEGVVASAAPGNPSSHDPRRFRAFRFRFADNALSRG